MKQKMLWTIGLIVLALRALVANPANAQTTAPGPYYAPPSWDQQLTCTSTSNCPRFIVLSNWIDVKHPSGGAAVVDRETGLVWEQSPGTSALFRWDSAQTHCNALDTGGRRGWRLPALQELASLVDLSVATSPSLPAGHPFAGVQSSNYWTATTFAVNTDNAWDVYFGNGDVSEFAKSDLLLVWCVRGGQGVPPQ